jgi:hypothetical protein
MSAIACRGFRFPWIVIQHAVWLYARFTLSLRDVEELLAERGITVSYETIRAWVTRFGPPIARKLRAQRGPSNGRWHLDEMLIPSAKSGGQAEGGEACHPRLGERQSIQPVDHSRDVHPDSDADLLEPGLRQPVVAAPPHPEGAHALRERTLHSGAPVVTLLP